MNYLAGKKERRSQKDKRRSDKLKGNRDTSKPKAKKKKNPYGKTNPDPEAEKKRKEKRKRDLEEGRAGLAGAGRAGRQPSKKQKEKSRKKKHKKRLYAAVARVASENPEFAKLLKAELKTADVDAVRGTAFNVARRLGGRVKEMPVAGVSSLRNYRNPKFILDPLAVAYVVSGINVRWSKRFSPTNDPQDEFEAEREGTYSVLFYPVLTKSGGHPGMVFRLSEEGKLPWQGRGLDEDYRVRRWEDKEIADWIKGSFESDLESLWTDEQDLIAEAKSRRASRVAAGIPAWTPEERRYFRGPGKQALRAMLKGEHPKWGLLNNAIESFEKYEAKFKEPGWEDPERATILGDGLKKLRGYMKALYPTGKPKPKPKRKPKSPGKILAEQMTDPAIVAMVRKLAPFFKRKPAEAAMFASEVLEDANFHGDNRLFNVPMADYDRDAVPLSYSDVARKLRWDSRVLPFAAALLIAAGAKGAARSMLKKWGDNNKDWLLKIGN